MTRRINPYEREINRGPTKSSVRQAQGRERSRLGFWEGVWQTAEFDAPLGAYLNNPLPPKDFDADPNFAMSREVLAQYAPNVPVDLHAELVSSVSKDDLLYRADHFTRIAGEQARVAESHYPLMSMMGGNIIDPIMLATMVGGAGVIRGVGSTLKGAGRIKSATTMGAVGSTEMAVAELPRLLHDPTYDTDRYMTAMFAGLGLGGILGGAFPSMVLGRGWKDGLPPELAARNAARRAGDAEGVAVPAKTIEVVPVGPRVFPEEEALNAYAVKLAERHGMTVPEGHTALTWFENLHRAGGGTVKMLKSGERRHLTKLRNQFKKVRKASDDSPVKMESETKQWHDDLAPEALGGGEARGLGSGLRGEVSSGMRSTNPRVRALSNMMGEHSRMKNTGHNHSVRAERLANSAVNMYRNIESKIAGMGINEAKRRRTMRDFGAHYRKGTLPAGPMAEAGAELRKLLKKEYEFLQKSTPELQGVDFNPRWLPRKSLTGKWNMMNNEVGEPAMLEFIESVLAKTNYKPATRTKIAKHWIKINTDKGYKAFQTQRQASPEKHALFVKELHKSFGKDMPSDAIDEIADMFAPRPQGGFKHAKSRLDADEAYEQVINGKMYRFVDLIENDTDALLRTYFQRMHGHVEWTNMMKKIGLDADSHVDDVISWASLSGEVHPVHAENLRYLYRDMMAVPAHHLDNAPAVKWLRHTQEFAYVISGNQLAFAQIAEAGNIMGEFGFKAIIAAVPGFQQLVNKMLRGKAGNFPAYIMHAMDNMGGVGREIHMRFDMSRSARDVGWQSVMGDSVTQFAADTLSSAKGLTNRFVTGLGWIDQSLRSYAVKGSIDRWVRLAYMVGDDGIVKLRPNWMKNVKSRIDDLGLSTKQVDDILETIRDTTNVRKRKFSNNVEVLEMRFADWDDELADVFFDALVRQTNRIIQRNVSGNLPPIFRNPVFRFMMMYRSFVTNAANKQMRYSINKRDSMAGLSWMYGIGMGGLAYVAQREMDTQLNQATGVYTEREAAEQRKKDYTMARIGAEAFRRTGQMSFLPEMFDTLVAGPLTGESFFHRYDMDLKGLLGADSAPAGVIHDLINLGQKTLERPAAEDSGALVRAASRVMPFANMPGMMHFLRRIKKEYD